MKRLVVVAVAACSSASQVPPPRFANAPAVEVVNDRRDVPKQPSTSEFLEDIYNYDGLVQRRLERTLELPPPTRARGVNALDEVPDSTWFTNRIGMRDMSVDEIVKGPLTIESPELHKPWTVTSTKTGGAEVGFAITDARGEKFLLKFDTAKYPEQETGAHVIVEKLLWACGYNVTSDYIVHFRDEDLVLAKDAVVKDSSRSEPRPLTREELEARLGLIQRDENGSYRALASQWLPGKPLGGHPAEGVREDDPNDRIPHELRRELRGFYTFAAWLDHSDIQQGNFLDVWVTDPADKTRHYVEHYLLDFGKSLGVYASTGHDPRRGYDYWFDPSEVLQSLVSFGLVERSWEDRRHVPIRGVGAYDAVTFDPDHWHPTTAAYVPFTTRDRFDGFWAAKILMRFTPAQIRAVVASAQYTDPRAVDYLTDMIIRRQRMTGAYWFARVNPLDRFGVEAGAVCFDDLALVYGFTDAATSYTATTFDERGHRLADATGQGHGPHACTRPLALGSGPDAYTIVEITTHRADFAGRTFVHLARDPKTHELRVIGVWRV